MGDMVNRWRDASAPEKVLGVGLAATGNARQLTASAPQPAESYPLKLLVETAHHPERVMSVGRDGASDAVSFLAAGVPAVEFGPVPRGPRARMPEKPRSSGAPTTAPFARA